MTSTSTATCARVSCASVAGHQVTYSFDRAEPSLWSRRLRPARGISVARSVRRFEALPTSNVSAYSTVWSRLTRCRLSCPPRGRRVRPGSSRGPLYDSREACETYSGTSAEQQPAVNTALSPWVAAAVLVAAALVTAALVTAAAAVVLVAASADRSAFGTTWKWGTRRLATRKAAPTSRSAHSGVMARIVRDHQRRSGARRTLPPH